MDRPGLYFPFIHIRDDNWLKAASLYWPSIRRLVPRRYPKRDNETAKALAAAEVLRDEDPSALLAATSWQMIDAIDNRAEALASKYSVDAARRAWDRRDLDPVTLWGAAPAFSFEEPWLGWIHTSKFSPMVLDRLVDMRLAIRGRKLYNAATHFTGRPQDWIGVHPLIADAYMSVLAQTISRSELFHPVTDQVDIRLIGPGSDATAVLSLLLGRAESGPSDQTTDAGVDRYVMLALQTVLPENLENVSASKIVKLRNTLEGELAEFRKFVGTQQQELTELAAIPRAKRRLEAFAEHVEQTIEVPLRQLEKGMQLHQIQPMRSLVLAGLASAPTAVASGPTLALATATLAAVGDAWWQTKEARAHQKGASQLAYLLDVRDAFTPRLLRTRIRKVLTGTYGTRDVWASARVR